MAYLKVERLQYGVGQGCFHGQEVTCDLENGKPKTTFRFVYDCGSTTKTALNWTIDHFTSKEKNFSIDALFISHFENDHVNGVGELCTRANVKRIYVPYLDQTIAIHIIAQACSASNKAGITSAEKNAVIDLASTLTEIVGDKTIKGRDVIMVRPQGDSPPETAFSPNELFDNENRSDLNQLDINIEFPSDLSPTRNLISNMSTASISVNGTTGRKSSIWEITHWSYGCDPNLTGEIFTELASISKASSDFFPGLQPGSTRGERVTSLKWVRAKFKEIAKAYQRAITTHNSDRVSNGKVAIPNDHNVTSLCIYSGPTIENFSLEYLNSKQACCRQQICCFCRRHPDPSVSWLATGDAMLEDVDIWNEFKNYFTQSRLAKCGTILVPHHGSGKGKNFNQKLVMQGVNYVISAGAKNNFRHPSRSVLSDIVFNAGHFIVVTENEHLGFTEHIKIEWRI